MNKRVLRGVLFSAGLAFANLAQVNQINFDDLVLPDFGDIAANYKGHDGDTANVGVSYRTISPANVVQFNHLDFWNNDYGDLSKVAFSVINGSFAEITFTPDAGFAVALLGFDLAGWPNVDRISDVTVSVGNSLARDFSGAIEGAVDGGPEHNSYAPNLVSGQSVTIRWGTDWNVGIDNISFQQIECTQVPESCRPNETPEPSTMAALALGLLMLGGLARRRRV